MTASDPLAVIEAMGAYVSMGGNASIARFDAALASLKREREDRERLLEEWQTDAEAVALQRDELRARLDRIRAAAESDADLAGLHGLRSFLLRETEPGVLHIAGVSGIARSAALDGEQEGNDG